MRCPKCGAELGFGARFCNLCGTEVIPQKSNRGRGGLALPLAALVLVLVTLISGLASYGIAAVVDRGVPELKKQLQKQEEPTQPAPTVPAYQMIPAAPTMPQKVTISYPVEAVYNYTFTTDTTRRTWVYPENWYQQTAFTVEIYETAFNKTSLYARRRYTEKTEYEEFNTTYSLKSITKTYDDHGREIFEERVNIDDYAMQNGTKDTIIAYTYNLQGLMEQIYRVSFDIYGNVNHDGTVQYQYTMQGKEYRREYSYGYDLYDAEGKLLLEVRDDPAVESRYGRYEYSYDAYGNLKTVRWYKDGELQSETAYAYETVEVSGDFAQRFPMFKVVN